MEVKTFIEHGILKICHECGATVLVGSDIVECPLCGSRDMEIDDEFGENGECSREDLAFDWFYNPDILPASMRRLNLEGTMVTPKHTETSVTESIDDAENVKEERLAPIISMFPTV